MTYIDAHNLSEDLIEKIVEREIDKLDTKFRYSGMSQEEYDGQYKLIDNWARYQYARTTGDWIKP